MALRTGEMFDASAAGFAVVAAAILPQDDSPPEIAGQLGQLFSQRHWLVEVRQEVAKRLSCHRIPLANQNGLSIHRRAGWQRTDEAQDFLIQAWACLFVDP